MQGNVSTNVVIVEIQDLHMILYLYLTRMTSFFHHRLNHLYIYIYVYNFMERGIVFVVSRIDEWEKCICLAELYVCV